MEKLKKFPGFDNCDFEIDVPIKIIVNLEINKLTVITGYNDVGKSYINKLFWIHNIFMSSLLQEQAMNVDVNAQLGMTNNERLTTLLGDTFRDHNTNGILGFKNEDCSMDVTIAHGTVVEFEVKMPKKQQIPISFPYLSTNTRLFTQLTPYTTILKVLKCKSALLDGEVYKTLKESYRLYDILAFEAIIGLLRSITPELIIKLNEQLKVFTTHNDVLMVPSFKTIGINPDFSTFYTTEKTSGTLDSLGTGAQSLVMMALQTIQII